jgi:hypothetical protein
MGKSGEQTAAAEHQPGLVAVPDGRHAVHEQVAIALLGKNGEEHADAEVEAVEHDVDEDSEDQQAGPDHARSMDQAAAGMSSSPPATRPAVRSGPSSATSAHPVPGAWPSGAACRKRRRRTPRSTRR